MNVSSPDVLQPKNPGANVRRVNRRPLAIGMGLLCLIAGALAWTIMDRTERAGARDESPKKADPAYATDVLANAPAAGLIEAREAPLPPPSPVPASRPERRGAVPAAAAPVVGQPVADDSYAKEWEQYRQAQAQVRQEKTQAARSALQAPPAVSFGENAGQGGAAGGMAGGAPGFVPPSMDAGVRERMERVAQLAAAAQGGAGEPDPNNATGKRDWLASEPDPVNYLDRGRAAPVSPYELKTGAVIPSTMIGGINSDLPGTIIGQVRENVWDTATGQHCLIPQGARLVGTYDNQVTRGQSRVLVAWNRIIYPNGSSLDIGSMPGSDSAGYAGFKDKTNNHYWRVFGDALMMSVFAAGIQLSQPESSAIDGGYDSQQIIAGSLGQQLGQAGMQITQKNLSIQPTLEIRPGYRFNIMVTKDIVLSPWEGGCSS